MLRFVLWLALACGLASPGLAGKRVGLIIGNDSYEAVPELDKARADASAIAEALQSQGFEVLMALDLSRRDMNRRISEFAGRLEPGDTAFVFFAGHGVEIDGENYLLPTDIAAPAAGGRDFIKSESIALGNLLDRVRGTGARAAVVIVDACRNNPFEITTGRSIGRTRGLGHITAPQGTFVIFSAGARQLALDALTEDDTAPNSVFTRALLPKLTQPGLELRPLMAELRIEVRDLARQVNHIQIPAYYDELIGEFYFASATEPADEPDPATAVTPDDPMRADFALARSVGTAAAMQAFLDRYKNRDGELTYHLARQIHTELVRSQGPSTDPALPKTDAAAPAEPDPDEVAAKASNREIVRATQEALNTRGCKAGAADGLAGRRTRAAFEEFVTASGADLAMNDLGTQAALEQIEATSGQICKPAVAAVAPRPADAAATPADPPALTLDGRWAFRASCALFVKSRGTVVFTSTGPGTYRATISDNLGNNGHADVRLNGRTIISTEYFPGIVNQFTGTLAADGNSYSGRSSNTCAVSAWRG